MAELKGKILAGKILVSPQEAEEKTPKRDHYPRFSKGKTTTRKSSVGWSS